MMVKDSVVGKNFKVAMEINSNESNRDKAMLGRPWTMNGAKKVLLNPNKYSASTVTGALKKLNLGGFHPDIEIDKLVSELAKKGYKKFDQVLYNLILEGHVSDKVIMQYIKIGDREVDNIRKVFEKMKPYFSRIGIGLWKNAFLEAMSIVRGGGDFEVGFKDERSGSIPYTKGGEIWYMDGTNAAGEPADTSEPHTAYALYYNPPEIKIIRVEKDDAMFADEEYGGIDMNEINVDRQGDGVDIQFDPAQIEGIENVQIDSFIPIIINITPIQSILPLLGLETMETTEDIALSIN